MTKCPLITQKLSKSLTAEALADSKRRNGWSNAELGEALGLSEGTVRNRLDDEDLKKPMLVHELLRIIQVDGPSVANILLAPLGYRLNALSSEAGASDALLLAAAKAALIAPLIEAASDNRIDRDEAQRLLPQMVALADQMTNFKAHLRAVIEGQDV